MQRQLLIALALVPACAVDAPGGGTSADTETNADADAGSETTPETGTESGPGACSDDRDCPPESTCELGECVPEDGTSTTTSTSDTGTEGCEAFGDCDPGLLCIEGECVAADPPPGCEAPTLIELAQPSANGLIAAIDVVDLDFDGADEVVAWIEDVGIGVLDPAEGQWQVSDYLTPVDTDSPSIVAIPVDDNPSFDVLVNHLGHFVEVGLDDGNGNFGFATQLNGLEHLRRVSFAGDDHRVFGQQTLVPFEIAELRILSPSSATVVDLDDDAHSFRPAEFDGAEGDELLGYFWCRAWTIRRVGNNNLVSAVELPSQGGPGHCRWFGADLDGDGRGELIARETLYWNVDVHGTLLSVFGGQSVPGLDASFAPRVTALVPEVFGLYVSGYGAEVVADLDGDGDDELILSLFGEPGGSMLWASDDALLGCWASDLQLPDEIVDARAADLDADGDDELVVLQASGALRIYDAG